MVARFDNCERERAGSHVRGAAREARRARRRADKHGWRAQPASLCDCVQGSGARAHLARSLRHVHDAHRGVCVFVRHQASLPLADVRRRRRQLRAGQQRVRGGQRRRASRRCAALLLLYSSAWLQRGYAPPRRAQAPPSRAPCAVWRRTGARAAAAARGPSAARTGSRTRSCAAVTTRCAQPAQSSGRSGAGGAHLLVERPVRVHRHEAQASRAAQRQARQTPETVSMPGAGARRAPVRTHAPRAADELGREQAAALLFAERVANAGLCKAIVCCAGHGRLLRASGGPHGAARTGSGQRARSAHGALCPRPVSGGTASNVGASSSHSHG